MRKTWTYIVEELKKVDIILLLAEVLLEEIIDGALEQERVVYGNETDFLVTEPTWLAATSYTRVHDIVGDQEECLQLSTQVRKQSSATNIATYQLHTPAQDSSLQVLIVRQRTSLQDLHCINDGQAAVQLASGNIVVQVLRPYILVRAG